MGTNEQLTTIQIIVTVLVLMILVTEEEEKRRRKKSHKKTENYQISTIQKKIFKKEHSIKN